MNFLVVTCSDTSLQLFSCAEISIYMFAYKYWFYCCISKDDSCSEEAEEDRSEDLHCATTLEFLRHIKQQKNSRILVHLGTSKAPIAAIVSTSSPVSGGSQSPGNGLKLSFRTLPSLPLGLIPLSLDSCSKEPILCNSDMTASNRGLCSPRLPFRCQLRFGC